MSYGMTMKDKYVYLVYLLVLSPLLFMILLFSYIIFNLNNVTQNCRHSRSLPYWPKLNLNTYISTFYIPDPAVSSLFRDKGEPGREFSSRTAPPAAQACLRAALARKKALFGCWVCRWRSSESWEGAV